MCTATLVAEDRVLTAAHCVQNQSQGSMTFTLGADLGSPAAASVVSGIAVAPGWSGNVQSGSDLAVLSLATPITGILPVNVHLGSPSAVVGTEMTLVGYGRQASDHITGIRRLARVTLESLSQQTLVYNFHGEGACHGDSGGPAFAEIGGVWHQIGVTSWGDPSCLSTGHYQRLDVLAPWLEAQGVPAPRALDCGASGCDGQCEEDQDCWGMMCPSGDCTAPSGRCVSDGACDADCGYADPDCGGGGSQDVCAVYGLYGNGVCNQGCFQPDPDCAQQQCYPYLDVVAGVCYAVTANRVSCGWWWYPSCNYYTCWC